MPSLELQLSPNEVAGREARVFVHDTLHDIQRDDLDAVVALLTTELVNNVVVHTGRSPTVRIIARSAGGVRVEVDDPSVDAPVLEVPDVRSEVGRGLLLVATIADDWGFELRHDGKTVWFEVAAAG